MMTNSRFQRKSLISLLALLPVAFSLFLLMAVFNGLTGQDVRASETPTLSMISIDPGTAGNSAELPPDTIIKKTIIKRISKENPNDTIIEEKEEIIVGEKIDIQNESDIVRHRGGGRSHVVIINDGENETMEHRSDGERHEVRVRSEIGDERRVHVVESDVFIEEGDSIKHIKVIKHGDGDMMEVNPDKKVIIRHSSGRESDILYIIDGKEFSDNEAMNNLDPDDIESMSVYKGEDAKKYTDKDYEGVIVIVTKNGKKK